MWDRRSAAYFGPEDGDLDELAALVAVLDSNKRTTAFTRMAAVFGRDFPAFLAVFAGETVAVPEVAYVEQLGYKVRLWKHVHDRGADYDAVKSAADRFGVPPARVLQVYDTIEHAVVRRLARTGGG
jgi:hypothetical protein